MLRTKRQSIKRLRRASREQLHELSAGFTIENKKKLTPNQWGYIVMGGATLVTIILIVIF